MVRTIIIICDSISAFSSGVGGFVVNSRGEVLLIQEKWLRNIKLVHWKLPGGVAESGTYQEVAHSLCL